MSSKTIDIFFGVTGQSLYFDAPEGRPSSIVSSTVYENSTGDNGTAEGALSGSAAVETNPNTTFDANSGLQQADERVANITATTGVVIGRRYLVTNALGEKEWGEVVALSAGASGYAVFREPLQNAYVATDTFVGTRITHAIDSTWVADSGNISGEFDPNAKYRWRVVYVVAGVAYVQDVYFDLVRYAGRHSVVASDVDRKFPGWMGRLETYHREDQGREIIDSAYDDVKFDLYNLNTPDQAIRNREAVNELVVLRAGMNVDPTEVNYRRYHDRFTQLMAMGKVDVSTDSSGAAQPAEVVSAWSK